MRSITFFLSLMVIVDVLLSASSVTAAIYSGGISWNSSAAGELMNELDGINWQVSLANGENTISFNTLQRPPICDARIYGNCIGDKKPTQRPCNLCNYCKRPG